MDNDSFTPSPMTSDTIDANTFGTSNGPLSRPEEKQDDTDGGSGSGPNLPPKYYTMPTSRKATEYKMDHPKRGQAFIFIHETFREDLKKLKLRKRHGASLEGENLKEALLHLGFLEEDITVHKDLPKDEIKTIIKNAARKVDHTDHDCLVVAISTYGDDGGLFGYDRKLQTQDLWEEFAADKCPSLIGKPKIFFIQACPEDRVHDDETDGNHHYKIPVFADFLIVSSTVPGAYAWHNAKCCSWFIDALCCKLKQHGREVDLVSLLTAVNLQVEKAFSSWEPHDPSIVKKKQMPCTSSMLTKKVIFTPKH